MTDLLYLFCLATAISVLIGFLLKRSRQSHGDSKLARTLRESEQIFGDLNEQTGHTFQTVDLFPRPTYSSCSGQSLLLGGLQCDKCGICIAPNEQKDSKYLNCKPLFVEDNKKIELDKNETNAELEEAEDETEEEPDHFGISREHHLINGNLPLVSFCAVCAQPAGHKPELADYFCSICHRCIHEQCLGLFLAALPTRFCDLSILARYSIPPWSVRVQRSYRLTPTRLLKGRTCKKASLIRICRPPNVPIDSWQPLLVFANRLSGSSDADAVLQAFRFYLHPVCQIFDLSIHQNPTAVFEAMNDLLPFGVSFFVLVAGGDGTFRWIANSLLQMADQFAKNNRDPLIGILPLGTGNDLARSLNLGAGHVGPLDVTEYIQDTLEKCKPIKLDRWQVSIGTITRNGRNGNGRATRSSRLTALKAWRPRLPAIMKYSVQNFFMYNYVSIGADALVTLSFARRRQSTPWLCSSRLVNKLLYGVYGLFDMFQRECHGLHKYIRLVCDGKLVENLPAIETICVLNIPSYAGGCRVLELGAEDESEDVIFSEQKIDDGIVEVIGIYSAMHMAQLIAGFGSPVRIAQAKSVKIDITKRFPVQCDGEAWTQAPCRLTISRVGQTRVMAMTAIE